MRSNDLIKATAILKDSYDYYDRIYHAWFDSDDLRERVIAETLRDVQEDIEEVFLQSNFDRNKVMTELSIRNTRIAELELEINQLKKELNK